MQERTRGLGKVGAANKEVKVAMEQKAAQAYREARDKTHFKSIHTQTDLLCSKCGSLVSIVHDEKASSQQLAEFIFSNYCTLGTCQKIRFSTVDLLPSPQSLT